MINKKINTIYSNKVRLICSAKCDPELGAKDEDVNNQRELSIIIILIFNHVQLTQFK